MPKAHGTHYGPQIALLPGCNLPARLPALLRYPSARRICQIKSNATAKAASLIHAGYPVDFGLPGLFPNS